MGLLKLETIESVLAEHLSYQPSGSPLPGRFNIGYTDAYATPEHSPMRPTRFSIRISKYALQKAGLETLFSTMRDTFDAEDRCMLLNDGDQGVVVEANADVKHKALIVLWELGIYNFQFTYRYESEFSSKLSGV